MEMDIDAQEKRDPAAESTDYRRHERHVSGLPRDPSANTARPHSPDTGYNSIRIHARTPRSSLAVRLAVPVVVCLILSFVVVCLVARANVRGLLLEDMRAETANVAAVSALFGRQIIAQHDKFLRDNPDYREKGEFRAGDHWLAAGGFVSESGWAAETGFRPEEIAPASVMFQAARRAALAGLERFLNPSGSNSDSGTDIAGIAVFNADDVVLASVQKDSFQFDAAALRAVPQQEARQYDAGATSVAVDFVEDFAPEPVMRGTARIFADGGGHERLGTVMLVLRTGRQLARVNEFLLLLFGLFALLAPALALVCWYSARRITVPLRRLAADMQALAEGDYARRSAIRENDETGLAAQAFNSMAERLRLARLNEQETGRLESDLSIARGIQNNLLPQQTPRVRGFDIHTSYRPAKEIGGDYFDFLPVDSEHMGLVIADASGKSIPAALVMSTTRAILRFVAPGEQSASVTLTKVNAVLSADIPRGMFVTAYYLILDPLSNSMLCASAGHTPLLIARRDGSVEIMNPGGIALGFDSGSIFQRSIREQRVRLESGDRVLLYTDGVVECVNSAGEEYSDRRLREFLRRNREMSSHDFVGALMTDLDRHRGTAEMRDDTTIVTFKML